MGSKNSQENKALMEIVSDDEPDEIIEPIAIKLASEAFQMVELDHDKLGRLLMKVSQKFRTCRLPADDNKR